MCSSGVKTSQKQLKGCISVHDYNLQSLQMLRLVFLPFITGALAQPTSDSEFEQDWAATTATEVHCVFSVAGFAAAVASMKVGT